MADTRAARLGIPALDGPGAFGVGVCTAGRSVAGTGRARAGDPDRASPRRVSLVVTAAWAVGVAGPRRPTRLGLADGPPARGRGRRQTDGCRHSPTGSRRVCGSAVGRACSLPPDAGCHLPSACFAPRSYLPSGARRWSGSAPGRCSPTRSPTSPRHDLLTQSIGYSACVLFWFVPPVWLAWAAMLREAEACCDQQVINRASTDRRTPGRSSIWYAAAAGRILLPVHTAALVRKNMVRQRIEDRPAPEARAGGGSGFAVRSGCSP